MLRHKNKCFLSCDRRDDSFILKTPLQSSTGSLILSSGNALYSLGYVGARLSAVCRCCQLTCPHLQQPSQHRASSSSNPGSHRPTHPGWGMFPGDTVADGPSHGVRSAASAAGSEAMSAGQNRRFPRCGELGGHHPQRRRCDQHVGRQVSWSWSRPDNTRTMSTFPPPSLVFLCVFFGLCASRFNHF